MSVYNTGKCSGPGCKTVIEHNYSAVDQAAFKHNLLWVVTCQVDQEKQAIPGWTGFTIKVHPGTKVEIDTISFLSAINAPAMDLFVWVEFYILSVCLAVPAI